MINLTPEKVIEPSPENSEVVLSVEGVSKKFCRDLKRSLFYGVRDIAGELTGFRKKSDKLRTKEFWALDNVSVQLTKGESLGLVGKNGSGKSTLLRIIAGLIKPDLGTVKVTGRVAPLIALGAGFNPILTGRENIYANMSILGLSTKEIDERFDDVVAFAEIGDAIDAPVQSYSSGMAARLGFASAIHTEPDILLIDEVLAVGDIKFRVKCYRRLAELSQQGASFVLVSHDSNSILSVCNHAVYLSKGKVIETGDAHLIMKKYEDTLFCDKAKQNTGKLVLPSKTKSESLGIDITYLYFKDRESNIIKTPVSGEVTNLCVGLSAHEKIEDVGVTILIKGQTLDSESNLRLSSFSDRQLFDILPGKYEIQLQMPYCGLKPGAYSMKISVSQGSLYLYDAIESFEFTVNNPGNMSQCSFYQPREWIIKLHNN